MAPGPVREVLRRCGSDGAGVLAGTSDDRANQSGPGGNGARGSGIESAARHQQLIGRACQVRFTGAEDEVEVPHANLIPNSRVVDTGRREAGIHASHSRAVQILDRGGWEDPEIAELVTRRPWRHEQGLHRGMSHRETERNQIPGCFRPGCQGSPPPGLGDPRSGDGGAGEAQELTTGSGMLERIHSHEHVHGTLVFKGRVVDSRSVGDTQVDGIFRGSETTAAIVWNGRRL